MKDLPACPWCDDPMQPAWGEFQCINRRCVDYLEPKSRNDVENEIEQAWYDAQQREFHRYHSY